MTDLVTEPEVGDGASAPDDGAQPTAPPSPEATTAGAARRRVGRMRRIAMRPRRVLVRVHRWLSFGLLAWLCVISVTGAWLVVHHPIESWLHHDRYQHTDGPDVGPDAALAAAQAAMPERATVYSLTLPRNGRGVYQAWAELPPADPDSAAESDYLQAFVDPGTGDVNGVRRDGEGANAWLYRGHEFLWQDHGLLGAFDPDTGWCRPVDGHEPGGAKGVACDVLPDGQDMVGWFALGFIVVLLTGFHLWYWPGVKRWATALLVRRGRGRFAFHLSLHKVVGLVVWVPLTVIAFTGAAFAFPNMDKWFENATPAQRDVVLWTTPDDLRSSRAAGRDPIGLDRAVALAEQRYPDRAIDSVQPPSDGSGLYFFWQTRGFDPWTREGGAGNTYLALDQYSGVTRYDGTPSEGNVADQLWDDWSFPLHTGDFGGTATRLLWVAVGLSPILLGATGTIMWLVRRGKRKRRPVAPAAAPTAIVEERPEESVRPVDPVGSPS